MHQALESEVELCLVLELVAGGSIRDALDDHGSFIKFHFFVVVLSVLSFFFCHFVFVVVYYYYYYYYYLLFLDFIPSCLHWI